HRRFRHAGGRAEGACRTGSRRLRRAGRPRDRVFVVDCFDSRRHREVDGTGNHRVEATSGGRDRRPPQLSMRYLRHAFFARPDIPLLRLPWNAIAIAAAAIAGWWDPSIWAVAGAGEFIYLFTMASNPGFQSWIDNRRLEELR